MWRSRLLLWSCVLLLAAQEAAALERAVHTRIANYDNAPIKLQQASTQLVESYGDVNQVALVTLVQDTAKTTRQRHIRNINRLNQQVPTYFLDGKLTLQNTSTKEIAVLQLTTVFLNAFRERVGTEQYSLTGPLPPRKTHHVEWSRSLPHHDVFELYVVVTKVRFSDGMVWMPMEEMILLP